jgi:bacteriocin-like protein
MKKLSKDEMKKVMGGVVQPLFNCQCNGTGTWSGHYGSAQEIADDISAYCANGGTCTAA